MSKKPPTTESEPVHPDVCDAIRDALRNILWSRQQELIVDFSPEGLLTALAKCYDHHLCNIADRRDAAQRRLKDAERIVERMRFIADCAGKKESYYNLSGDGLGLTMAGMMRVLIGQIESLMAGDRGLVQGHQSHDEVDYLAGFLRKRNDE